MSVIVLLVSLLVLAFTSGSLLGGAVGYVKGYLDAGRDWWATYTGYLP